MLKVGEAKKVLKQLIKQYYKQGTNLKPPVIYLEGGPGIGKTSIVRQIAKELNVEFLETDLLSRGPQDFQIIWPNSQSKTADILIPENSIFPTFEKGIWLFDEFVSAQSDLQTLIKRFINERILPNGKKLPDGIITILTGNRINDNATRYQTPAPVVNSFLYYELSPDPMDWVINYAHPNEIHDIVISFITTYSDKFYTYNSENWDGKQFASPRSYEMLSNLLKILGENLNIEHVIATVGTEVAFQFQTFTNFVIKLPKIETILDNDMTVSDAIRAAKIKPNTSDEIGAQVFIMEAAHNYIIKNPNKLDKFFNLISKVPSEGIAVASMLQTIKQLISKNIIKLNDPNIKNIFDKIANTYKDYVNILT
ncbi:MAG: AAA family ATPase, partial [Thermoplasmata archaeon]